MQASFTALSRMTGRCEAFGHCRTTTPLPFLNLYTIFCGFMDVQMSKIECVNYAGFPKSGHIYVY